MGVELVTCVMVHNSDTDEVLIQDRKRSYPGWSFPGGHVEQGESIHDCAVREVKEETGLDVDGLQYCGVVHWANTVNDDRYLCFMYRTSRFRGELIGETDEGRQFWIKREALFSAHESQFSCVHFALFHQPGRFREVMITNQEDEMICDYRLR